MVTMVGRNAYGDGSGYGYGSGYSFGFGDGYGGGRGDGYGFRLSSTAAVGL